MARPDVSRLFLAIELFEDIRRVVAGIQRRVKQANLFRGSFGKTKNLHLTLKFLGDVAVDRVSELAAALEQVRFSRFTAKLGALGTFGGRRPRVVWVSLEGSGLVPLQAGVEAALADYCEPAAKEFRPHLTIARVKQIRRGVRLAEELKTIAVPAAAMEVDRFSLIRSRLHPAGSIYTRLHVFEAQEH